jgi:hypothetical protein
VTAKANAKIAKTAKNAEGSRRQNLVSSFATFAFSAVFASLMFVLR